MKQDTKSAFSASLTLHLVFLVSLFVVPWLLSLRQQPQELFFELVTLPPEGQVAEAQPEPQPPVEEPLPEESSLRVQELEALAELPEIDLERLREPEPEPEPEPQPAPRPAPRPTPAPEPAPQRISYEEWRQGRNLPNQQTQTAQRPRQSAPRPQIDTQVRERLQSALSEITYDRTDRASSVTDDQMAAYISALSQRLQTAFEPSGNNFETEVEFQVLANGRFGNIRILQSSGNRAFDDAVRRTFQRTQPPGSPPGNRAYTFTLTFRSTD